MSPSPASEVETRSFRLFPKPHLPSVLEPPMSHLSLQVSKQSFKLCPSISPFYTISQRQQTSIPLVWTRFSHLDFPLFLSTWKKSSILLRSLPWWKVITSEHMIWILPFLGFPYLAVRPCKGQGRRFGSGCLLFGTHTCILELFKCLFFEFLQYCYIAYQSRICLVIKYLSRQISNSVQSDAFYRI